MLRKVLRMNTTYIDRENTNERVSEQANQRCQNEGRRKIIVPFKEAYTKLKMKRAGKVITNRNSPIYRISFQDNKLNKWIHNNSRVGRPRKNWTEETIT